MRLSRASRLMSNRHNEMTSTGILLARTTIKLKLVTLYGF